MSKSLPDDCSCWGSHLMQSRDCDDVAAFTQFVLDSESQLYRCLCNWLGKVPGARETARDVLQETYVQVHRKLTTSTAATPSQMRNWVFTIARHLAVDYIRSPKSRIAVDGEAAASLDSFTVDSYPDKKASGEDAIWLSQEALSVLEDEVRELVELRFCGGLTFDEIAALNDQTLNAVASRIYRGLEQMRLHVKALLRDRDQ